MLTPPGSYTGLIVFQFLTRQSVIEKNECRLIRKEHSVVLLLAFSIAALVYLASGFLIPIWRAQTSKDISQKVVTRRLRQIALRGFWGTVGILVTISANRIVHVIFNGFPIWLTVDTDMTVICIVCLAITWMSFEDTRRGSSSTASGQAPSMQQSRSGINNVDWMSPDPEDVDDDAPVQRNHSKGSTVVTIEASSKQPESLPSNGISVAIERTTHYESASQPRKPESGNVRSKGSKWASFSSKKRSSKESSNKAAHPFSPELSFVTSVLDGAEEEDGMMAGAGVISGTDMAPTVEPEPKPHDRRDNE
jgi:hypothetical protein